MTQAEIVVYFVLPIAGFLLGSIPFAIAIFVLLYRWLAPQLSPQPAHP